MRPYLELREISKSYPGHAPALAPTCLDVREGEFVVLVGPSGCGKSTLLRLIAGLEQPTSGEVSLAGRTITNLPPAERDVAMVFQNYALYPHMTVADNIGFALRMRGVPAAARQQAVQETAELLGLRELLGRTPGQLSGGQRQRVALGRAIVRRPKLFLFDEPLSNLDASLRASTRVELRRLHQQLQATSLYVTHDQTEAMTMGDRLVVLQSGHVQQIGSPLEVYRQPANRFVAGFIGTPPMNLLRVRMREECLQVADALLEWPQYRFAGEALWGLRAEQIGYDALPAGDVSASVVWREALGNETMLVCALADGQEVTLRGPAEHAPGPGEQVGLRLDRQSPPILFHPGSGDRLTLST